MKTQRENPAPPPRDFPAHFVWGAATCAACCEGETVNDWGRLAATDGSVPDDGPRHWRRYRFDYKAMADLGLTAYRFNCDWGRLQRAPGTPFNRDDTLRYLEMLAELRGLGIEPWLALFQNAMPRWAAAAGGWLNPEMPHWFADFAARLADVTDGEVRHWLTVHEPQMYALSCYVWGSFPGGAWGRLDQARTALKRLQEGHRLAARALRRRLPDARIGVSLPGGCFVPRQAWNPGAWLAAWTSDWFCNRAGLRHFLREGDCDFAMLGVGNELRVGVDALSLSSCVSPSLPRRMREGDAGIDDNRRRRRLATWLKSLGIPVYLVGSAAEERKAETLAELLRAYASANGGGAAGFFYDPLLDQFDLDKGLGDGRGLLRVDFRGPDRRRELRPFARRYGEIARSGIIGSGK